MAIENQRVPSGQRAGGQVMEEAQTTGDMAQQYLEQGRAQLQGVVSEHPLSSVMVLFGVGFGLGLLVGNSIAGPQPSTWERANRSFQSGWKQAQRGTRRTANQAGTAAESFGHQMMDAITNALPDAISRHIS